MRDRVWSRKSLLRLWKQHVRGRRLRLPLPAVVAQKTLIEGRFPSLERRKVWIAHRGATRVSFDSLSAGVDRPERARRGLARPQTSTRVCRAISAIPCPKGSTAEKATVQDEHDVQLRLENP